MDLVSYLASDVRCWIRLEVCRSQVVNAALVDSPAVTFQTVIFGTDGYPVMTVPLDIKIGPAVPEIESVY